MLHNIRNGLKDVAAVVRVWLVVTGREDVQNRVGHFINLLVILLNQSFLLGTDVLRLVNIQFVSIIVIGIRVKTLPRVVFVLLLQR